MKSVSVTVKGHVQGVFFRQSTKETALRLGITGEVKNLSDGDVSIIATGSEEHLDEFIHWCNRGPEKAVVSEVIVETLSFRQFPDFRIAR